MWRFTATRASVLLVRGSCADSRGFLYSEAEHMLLFWVSALAAREQAIAALWSSRPSGHRREVLHANPEGSSNSEAVVVRTRRFERPQTSCKASQ